LNLADENHLSNGFSISISLFFGLPEKSKDCA